MSLGNSFLDNRQVRYFGFLGSWHLQKHVSDEEKETAHTHIRGHKQFRDRGLSGSFQAFEYYLSLFTLEVAPRSSVYTPEWYS